jgi:hypothetical protein
MNDLPNDPQFDEPSISRQVAAGDWARAEIESQPETPPPRERLFSRKVLIGWALFAVALYFGVGIARTVIKESIKSSISAVSDQIPRDKTTIYQTPNGKVTISRSKNGSITISTDKIVVTVPATPTPEAAPAPKAPSAVPAPKAVPAPIPPTRR